MHGASSLRPYHFLYGDMNTVVAVWPDIWYGATFEQIEYYGGYHTKYRATSNVFMFDQHITFKKTTWPAQCSGHMAINGHHCYYI
jgi:hypothetical protein